MYPRHHEGSVEAQTLRPKPGAREPRRGRTSRTRPVIALWARWHTDPAATVRRIPSGTVWALFEDAAMVEWSEFRYAGVDGRHITSCVLA